jgi:hypothetical protein
MRGCQEALGVEPACCRHARNAEDENARHAHEAHDRVDKQWDDAAACAFGEHQVEIGAGLDAGFRGSHGVAHRLDCLADPLDGIFAGTLGGQVGDYCFEKLANRCHPPRRRECRLPPIPPIQTGQRG